MSIKPRGFTLLELLVALTIIAITSSVATPLYTEYAERARESQALSDLLAIQIAIERYSADNFAFPNELDELNQIELIDPWGNEYQYLRIDGNPQKGIRGKQRKDKNLNPLNSDFDLYSRWRDADSKPPLTAKVSHDDLIRTGNGGWVGLGADH